MADYPTPSQYQEAMQNPGGTLRDPELQEATPRTNVLDLPQPITGAFAAVFPMRTSSGAQVAAKCFLKERPRQEARYEAVADHLANVNLGALVGFDYQPHGIRVRGTAYPLLKMEWARGTVLNRFVDDHLDAPDTLARLANAWADLMDALEDRSLAHGDLQHGNVLVQPTDSGLQLRLVDYDTMYVPALDGNTSAEVGHRNYQHPDRTDDDFGPHLDRFSGLAIYTALRACALEPGLWDRYDTGENLLFRDADFYAPDESPLFDDLEALDPLEDLVSALRTACHVEPDAVPPLADVQAGTATPVALSTSRSRHSRASTDASRSPFARAFLPSALALLVLAGGLAVLAGPVVGGAVATGAALTGGGLATRHYRRLSVVRRRRRLRQEKEHFEEAIQGLERERAHLKEKRTDLRSSMAERRAQRLDELQDEALRDRLKHHFIGEVRSVDGIIHKHVVRLKAANIRTAYEATPEAVASVRRISDEARARINMWRAALARKYEDEIPDALSPAEERRLRRYVEHRIEDIDARLARVREKIEVQRTEQAEIQERLDAMPSLTPLRYLRYLCRIATLPDRQDTPPTPAVPSRPSRERSKPVPEPTTEDETWWRQRRPANP